MRFIDFDKNLRFLDEYCEFLEFSLFKNDNGTFGLYDEQLNEEVCHIGSYKDENSYEGTFEQVVDRVLGKASAYYLDEWDYDDTMYNEVLEVYKALYSIAKRYNLQDEYVFLLNDIKRIEEELYNKGVIRKKLEKLTKNEIIDFIIEYNNYLLDFDEDLATLDRTPVCIAEYYDNEFEIAAK